MNAISANAVKTQL